MGNSEVGHLTIGSGRILFQDLARVNHAVADGSFARNEALVSAFRRARERGGDVHLLGLVSYGGVHSHIDHLRALLALAESEGMAERTWIHAFTDGRDVSPHARRDDLAELPASGSRPSAAATTRWTATAAGSGPTARSPRSERRGEHATIPVAAVRASYERGVTDEFVEPVVSTGDPRLGPANDTAIFFNFRPGSRPPALAAPARGRHRPRDDDALPRRLPVPGGVRRAGGARTRSRRSSPRAGLRQLHVAETEKYAHVTYFFNGGEEAEWEGETRILVPSPRDVPSYDLKPEMSAAEVASACATRSATATRSASSTSRIPDMVGHTGSIPAVVAAVEAADRALGRVECVDGMRRRGVW